MAKVRKRKWTYKGVEKSAWIVDYFHSDGSRKQETYARKKDADVRLVEIQGRLKDGTHVPDSESKTIEEAGDLWIEQCEHDKLEFSTIRQYKQHLREHINPYIGTIKLSQLTAPTVNKLLRQLAIDGRSDAMVRKVRSSVVGLISNAQQEGLIGHNVAKAARKQKKSKRHKKQLRVGDGIPTKVELRTIIDTASDRWRPFFVTAIFTGMRASELRGLAWRDVDFKGKVIHVRQRADLWGNIGSLKSAAAERQIPMAEYVANTLKEWKLRCSKSDLDLVFPNDKGKVQDWSRVFNQIYTPLLVEQGIVDGDGKPLFNFHALRHAAASLFIEQGWPPNKIQDVMGHKSITMTFDVYGHLYPSPEDDQKDLAEIQMRVLA